MDANQVMGLPFMLLLCRRSDCPKNILPKTRFKQWSWKFAPSPDVQYQWNLEALSCIASMLSEVFNKEYESGEKDTYDYGKEMKKFYGKKFSVSQCHFYMI